MKRVTHFTLLSLELLKNKTNVAAVQEAQAAIQETDSIFQEWKMTVSMRDSS